MQHFHHTVHRFIFCVYCGQGQWRLPPPNPGRDETDTSVVVLEGSLCPGGSSRTNFQVLILGAQVLVLVLVLELQVLVLVLGSSSP